MFAGLNFHHLYAFWMIAEAGSLSAAAARMHVTHSTLSVQLRALEDALGGHLFERRGRGLVITPFGEEVRARAAEIFRLGRDLRDLAERGTTGGRLTLRVGVLGSLPKTIACRLVEGALDRNTTVELQHGSFERLLESLAAGRLQVVIADQPPPQGSPLRLYAHQLGESGLLLYAAGKLARERRGKFPESLQGAPMLLPRAGSALRRQLDQWLGDRELHVDVIGEIDDAGTLRAFGMRGHGLFPVRSALAAEIEDIEGARRVGTLDGLRERYHAITRERTVRHPAILRMIDRARTRLE